MIFLGNCRARATNWIYECERRDLNYGTRKGNAVVSETFIVDV